MRIELEQKAETEAKIRRETIRARVVLGLALVVGFVILALLDR